MGTYNHRKPQGYDAQQVLLDAGAVTANITAGAGASNVVRIGVNVPLEIVAQVRGTVGGTTPTLDLKIQESSDGTTFTDVVSGAISQFTAAGEKRVIVRTTKEYVSVAGTIGGTGTPSFGDTEVFIVSPSK